MTDLERFARRLVERLQARDPTGRHRPVNIAELRTTIMPYRMNRSALGLSSHEDYELLILRLVAEEGGFTRTNPPESAIRCREEVNAPNPDLEIVEDLNDTTIQFGTRDSALGARDTAADQPDPPIPEPVVEQAVEPTPEPAPEPIAESLAERRVPSAERREPSYCPHCGNRVSPLHCARCGAAIELGWRHCVTCGALAGRE